LQLEFQLQFLARNFWGGMGFREGLQPTPEQLKAAVDYNLRWGILHRLVPLFRDFGRVNQLWILRSSQRKEHNHETQTH